MGVLVGWDDETKTSIRIDMKGRWTWDEIERAVFNCVELAKPVGYRVNILVDFTHSGPMPLGVIPRSRKLILPLLPYLNRLFIINGDAFVNLIAGVFQKVYPELGEVVHFAASLGEARLMKDDEKPPAKLRK